MIHKYNNAFLDDLVYTEQEKAENKAKEAKMQTLLNLANQPAATTNKWLIIIPVVVLVIGGGIAFFLLKKKK
jgi:hypothetical protein